MHYVGVYKIEANLNDMQYTLPGGLFYLLNVQSKMFPYKYLVKVLRKKWKYSSDLNIILKYST